MSLEQMFFGLSALACIVGSLLTVLARNPIRSALSLLLAVVGVAGLFVGMQAHYLAAIELIVYAGAIVVLFLFVIMLIGPDAAPNRDARAAVSRLVSAGALGVGGLLGGYVFLRATIGHPHELPPPRAEFGTIDAFGRELFTSGLVPFELATALFLVAVVGALAIGRGSSRSSRAMDATSAGRGEPTGSDAQGDAQSANGTRGATAIEGQPVASGGAR